VLEQELAFMPAVELSHRIKAREVSPSELVEVALGRIEERNPSLNAVIQVYAEEARARGRDATQALMAGEDWGPLHGVPTLIKDGFGQKPGWVSTYGGVEALRRLRDAGYCTFAECVESAGAIILGKTNSPTMGFRGTCDNYLFGPTRNPFDLTRNSGGSSGGSAAAVADGLVSFAEGTDGGGSIRIPAAWCGLVGFKPSWGRVPTRRRPNAFNVSPFAAEGPITRSVRDSALIAELICRPDPRDPFCLTEPLDCSGVLDGDVAGWKIAFSPDFGVYPVEPEVATVVAQAAMAFEECGASVREIDFRLPYDQRQLSDLWCRMLALLNLDTMASFRARGVDILTDGRDSLPPEYLGWMDRARRLTRADVDRDGVMRTAVFDAIQSVFESHDLLLTPTLACLPVVNSDDGNTLGPERIGEVAVDPLIGWCMTYFLNFTGHPAISVPAGLSREGLPVGLQIVGRRLADRAVLTAAAALERARPWYGTYERCARRPLGV
jgi:amidase